MSQEEIPPTDRGVSPYLSPGTYLGNYRIESFIDRGGMAFVYEATDLRLERHVALKVLAPELSEDPEFQQRFLRESRFAASLDHPNIVPIYDAGDAGGLLYMAMRHVSGGDLTALLTEQGRLTPQQTVSILSAVASALDAAHAAGLVHRDVKPGNILIGAPEHRGAVGQVYLSDFGLTKRLSSKSKLTAAGTFAGTMSYVSPEQIQGHDVDARSDLYALGCVAYECLTGVAPFVREEQAALLWAHVTETPAPASSHDITLAAADAVLARALAKEPGDRFEGAADFVAALADALEVPGARLREPVLAETASRLQTVAPRPPHGAPDPEVTVGAPVVHVRYAPVRRGRWSVRGREGRWERSGPWLWSAVAVIVAVAVAAAWFLVGAPDRTEAASSSTVSLPFALETYGGGVEVSRTWSLRPSGDRLHGELIVTGGTPGAAFDEVIPKSLATSADQVMAHPPAQQVVRADPVLRFAAGTAAGAQVTVTYDIRVKAQRPTRARLEAWAADQKRERDQYFASINAPAPTTLASLTIRPDKLSVTVGGPHRLALTGTDTAGKPTAQDQLDKAVWTTSDTRVVAVSQSGVVTGRTPGSVSVRAELGAVASEAVVLVADPTRPVTKQSYSLPDGRVVSPGPMGAPVVIAPVAPQICSTPETGAGCPKSTSAPSSPPTCTGSACKPEPCRSGSTRGDDGTCHPDIDCGGGITVPYDQTCTSKPCRSGSTRGDDGTCHPDIDCGGGITVPYDQTCPPCPEGSTRDSNGTCQPDTCPSGNTRGDDGICHPDIDCGGGITVPYDHTCPPCPEGSTRGDDGTCHPDIDCGGGITVPYDHTCPPCPEGSTRDSSGTCHPDTCPEGSTRDSEGTCRPDPVSPPDPEPTPPDGGSAPAPGDSDVLGSPSTGSNIGSDPRGTPSTTSTDGGSR